MNHEDYQARIDAYVDGTLPESERRGLEAHLKTCSECAAEVDGIRALLDRTRDLPRSIAPERDLWPEIEMRAGLETEAASVPEPARTTRMSWTWGRAVAMAAALAIVAGGVFLMSRDRDPRPPATAPVATLPAGVAPTIRALEAESQGLAKQLMAALKSGPGPVGSTTVTAITENIKLLDQAVDETRAALAAEPDNRQILRRLMEQYERRLTLLRRATRLANEDLV